MLSKTVFLIENNKIYLFNSNINGKEYTFNGKPTIFCHIFKGYRSKKLVTYQIWYTYEAILTV